MDKLKQIEKMFRKEHMIDIKKKSRSEDVSCATQAFTFVCLQNGYSLENISQALNANYNTIVYRKRTSLDKNETKDPMFMYFKQKFIGYFEDYRKQIKPEFRYLKVYTINFKGYWSVPHGLVIAAYNEKQAKKIASDTIKHTDEFEVIELNIDKPCVIFYESGDY